MYLRRLLRLPLPQRCMHWTSLQQYLKRLLLRLPPCQPLLQQQLLQP
jgi:hypothetical protein